MIGTVSIFSLALTRTQAEPQYKIVEAPSVSEAITVIQKNRGAVIKGEKITFAFKGKAEKVDLSGGIRASMTQLDNEGSLWGLSILMKDADRLIMSYNFASTVSGKASLAFANDDPIIRGRQLGKGFQKKNADSLKIDDQIESVNLLNKQGEKETRRLEVYLPPKNLLTNGERPFALFCADTSARGFVGSLLPLMEKKVIPPIALVGVQQGKYHGKPGENYDPLNDDRARDYVPAFDPPRFDAHMKFFTEEVVQYVESKYAIGGSRDKRGVIGFSNGGVFAAFAGIRGGNIFSLSVPLSAGQMFKDIVKPDGILPKFYCAAGTLEPGFLRGTTTLSEKLKQWGVEVKMTPRVAGHDLAMWQDEGTKAILWNFGKLKDK